MLLNQQNQQTAGQIAELLSNKGAKFIFCMGMTVENEVIVVSPKILSRDEINAILRRYLDGTIG